MMRSFLGSIAPLPPNDKTAALPLSDLSRLFDPSRFAALQANPASSPSSPASLAASFMNAYPGYDYDDTSLPLIFSANSDVPMHQRMERVLRNTQNIICQHILNIEAQHDAKLNTKARSIDDATLQSTNQLKTDEAAIGMYIKQDTTIRADGGGIARVLQGGSIFQKAGVNISVANVSLPFYKLSDMAEDHREINLLLARNSYHKAQQRVTGDKALFPVFADNDKITRFTASLSLVIHPVNPYSPTSHANYRYFEFTLPDQSKIAWFAGGSDLTPSYVNDEDATHFHQTLAAVCDRHDATFYPRYKRWCDNYFYIKHRQETRGVGGIFMDDMNMASTGKSPEQLFAFISDCAHNFSRSYFPLVLKHSSSPYTKRHHDWQQMRRSRYVEFNLMYDKGTSFGLAQANARPEAILMSLPLTCRFEYKHAVAAGSEEERTLQILKKPREWVVNNKNALVNS